MALIVVALVALAAIPSSPGDLAARPDPALTYDEAVARFDALRQQEDRIGVFDECRSRLLTQGQRADVAVILVHGLTNCPKQFVEFGEHLHAQGANVLILRAPHHGIANADRTAVGSVSELANLTPAELRDYADTAADIGHGLGDERRALGLSMGGVITAWLTQNRPDITQTVVASPALSLPVGPPFLTTAARNLFSRLPSITLPGSDKTGINHVYNGETTRGLAAMYQLAAYVRDQAASQPPAARTIDVDWNANDDQVNNVDVEALANAWAARGALVTTYEFPQSLGLPHDLIDPAQKTGDVAAVYPRLWEQLGFAG